MVLSLTVTLPYQDADVPLLPPPPPPDGDSHLFVRARAWRPSIDGRFRAFDGSVPSSRIEFDGDLGLDAGGSAGRLEVGGAWKASKGGNAVLGLRASYMWCRLEADETLERTETFDGTTFLAGTPVKSDLSVDLAGVDLLIATSNEEGTLSAEITLGLYVSAV